MGRDAIVSVILAYLFAVNLAAFLMMGVDKRRSKREGVRRIPEKTLFLFALVGGSAGAVVGMRIFHHKTKHWYFVWGMPMILVLQITLGAFLLVR